MTSSYLWSKFHRISISTSIMAHLYGDDDAGLFASHLLKVGDVQLSAARSVNQVILHFGQSVDIEDALITYVFPRTPENYRDRTWLNEKVYPGT